MQANTNIQPERTLAFDQKSARIANRNTKSDSLVPGIGVVIVALLAMATVQIFRAGNSRWLFLLVVEVAVFSVLPWIILGVLRNKFRTKANGLTKTTIAGFQIGAILFGALVLVWQCVIRPFGFGDANEIVALLIIQNVGWYMAVFSKVRGFEKTSSILSGALVFFVCCIADDRRIFLIAGLFAFSALWWLLGQYWSRLETKAIDGDSQSLKLHGSAVSATMLIMVLVACLASTISGTEKGNPLIGFMPFSGGEQGSQSEFALSGVGDGDMLTAGKNATTTGPVESDEFIEDHKPSLYDVMLERYEGPVAKREKNKAVSIDAIALHLHEAKKSEQAGRTFRTMRNSEETMELDLEDRISEALFFVEGSVPARFSINNFCTFDGWDWSLASNDAGIEKLPRIELSKRSGIPVFSLVRNAASYLTGQRSHRVKVMRLDSCIVPAPALLDRWHIPLVDRRDMFGWGKAGLIEMDCKSIPSHTLIDLQSLVPNYHLLRDYPSSEHGPSKNSSKNPAVADTVSAHLQVPPIPSRGAIQALANQWTTGIEPGWKQVESIVNHLRSDFVLDSNWELDDEADDSISLFLQQGGGPTYMFATSCAMTLRAAGYKTRLASGFLVQKKDYDSKARQSVVTSENLHMWPEVCLDGNLWIPVEPTPGYPTPYSTQTAWQWLSAQAMVACRWLLSHPISVTLFLASLAIVFWYRAEWITFLMYGWWFLVRTFWPQSLLRATRQLIDLRFWFAGDRRPGSQTISFWYRRVESKETTTFSNLWNAKNYSDRAASVSRQDVVVACRQTIDALSLKRIKHFVKTKRSLTQ